MLFRDRVHAGKLLAKALKQYRNRDVVVYALPRGGVVTAFEIAKYLHVPLDLIITRKIGHPLQPEYAIAATAENGHIVGTRRELTSVDEKWLEGEITKQREEAKRRGETYLQGREDVPVKGKIAILVDDGVATGLTMRVGIKELRHRSPKKIIVAVPVVPRGTVDILRKEADEIVALDIPPEDTFLGAVGAYYNSFPQVDDGQVTSLLSQSLPSSISEAAVLQRLDPVLFAFPQFDYMRDVLDKRKNTQRGSFAIRHFTNKEMHATVTTPIANEDVFVLGSVAPPDHQTLSYLLLVHTLQKEGARRIFALLPYLAYSRHDKRVKGESLATEWMGKLLSASGVNMLITVDIHRRYEKRLFPLPCISLSPSKLFAEELQKLSGISRFRFVAPDEGAKSRCKALAKVMGFGGRIAFIEKKRSKLGISHTTLHGKVGEKVIVVDDILDTGETLISCCKKLLEAGVQEIVICVTHGLFTGRRWEELFQLRVSRIYVTDSIPRLIPLVYGRVRYLSIAPLLYEVLSKEFSKNARFDDGNRFAYYT